MVLVRASALPLSEVVKPVSLAAFVPSPRWPNWYRHRQ
jgi:hypothetical protein